MVSDSRVTTKRLVETCIVFYGVGAVEVDVVEADVDVVDVDVDVVYANADLVLDAGNVYVYHEILWYVCTHK